MDYGKFKYREAKKQHEAKLKLKQIQVKEVKFRPGTDEGDYQIKLRNLIRFLGGRRQGQDHAALSRARDGAPGVRSAPAGTHSRTISNRIAVVESWPRLEGRQMVMLLAPKRRAGQAETRSKHPATEA